MSGGCVSIEEGHGLVYGFYSCLAVFFRVKQYLIQMDFRVDLSNSIECVIVGIYIKYLTLHYEIAAPPAPFNQFGYNK